MMRATILEVGSNKTVKVLFQPKDRDSCTATIPVELLELISDEFTGREPSHDLDGKSFHTRVPRRNGLLESHVSAPK